QAFYSCSSLTSIYFPDSLTEIGYQAFGYCSSLTAIDLPDSLTEIGSSAFSDCSSLTAIDFPDSLTEIGGTAFLSCSSLTAIDLPKSLTEIGGYAFYYCSKLTDIKVNWETPLTVTSAEVFSTYSTATLTVPVGTLEAYKADSFWGQFYNIVEDSTLAVEDIEMDDSAKVYTVNGVIMISGAEDGAAIKVYNLNGVNVANGVVLDGTAQIELPTASGIYIVTVGNQSYKVVR
ncbi:MAG: leucine-rich repeat domain-containing protein, partial [Bacteroidales bacterium]